jgi:NAD(P)H dehydrogenase (quinone)
VAAAKAAGVKHLLYTSMVRPSLANPALLAIDHRGTESAVVHSGIPYTLLRNNWYLENLLGGFVGACASGVLSEATGSGRAAYVSREDCAAAAAGALAAQEEKSSVREISGPELLSLSDIAAALSELGRTVEARPVDEATRIAQLEAVGVPSGFATVLANSELAISQGWFAVLSDDVRTLSGRAPRDLRTFLRDHRTELG